MTTPSTRICARVLLGELTQHALQRGSEGKPEAACALP